MRATALAVLVALAGVAGFAVAILTMGRLGSDPPYLAAGIAATAVVGLLIGLIVARAATHPLRAIGRVAHALRDGATDARVRGVDGPEIRALNEALDSLVRARSAAEASLAPFQAEAARREDDLQRLVGATTEGLWVYDHAAGSVAFSPRARRLLGLPDSAKDSLPAWEDAVAPEDRMILREALRAAAEGHRAPFEVEQRVATNDGRRLTLLVRGSAREADPGNIVAGSIADVTGERRLASELSTARETVAGMEGRLGQERARVTRALLADPGGATEATAMLAELLAVTPPSTPSREPFDPRLVAEDAVATAARAVRAKGAELILEVDPEVPPLVRNDGGLVRRMMDLALARAAAAPGSEVVVSVAHRREELLVWIKDGGPALPAKVVDAPEEPLPDSPDGAPNLRVALLHRLANILGGRLGIESARGKGTTLLLAVPAETVPVANPALKPVQRGRLRGMRALLVDDNATSLRVLAQEAESWGVVHREVASADEALAALRAEPFDLAIVDQGLPGGDGFELARRMRGLPHGSLAVVVLTTGEIDLDETELQTLGIEGAVPKPFRAGRLYATVAGLADRREFVGRGVEVKSSAATPVAAIEAPSPPSAIEFRSATPLERPKTKRAPRDSPTAAPAPAATAKAGTAQPPLRMPIPETNKAAKPPAGRPSLFQADPTRQRPTPAAARPDASPARATPAPAPTASATPGRPRPATALDPKLLARLRLEHGDAATADRLAAYVDRSTTHVAEMRGAIATGDAGAFERAARELQRLSQDLGVSQVAASSDELGTLARAGKIDAVARRFLELENAHRHARRAIEVEKRRPVL